MTNELSARTIIGTQPIHLFKFSFMLKVQFYQTENGVEPVRKWLKEELTEEDRKIIGEDVKTVQEGFPMGMPLGLWVAVYGKCARLSRVNELLEFCFFTMPIN